MNVLALEASSLRGSIAALAGEALIFDETFPSERGHSSGFFVNLESAVRALGRCDTIAVGLGPGSYSGVRIAISAAIGLSFGTRAALVGIPSVLAFETDAPRYRVIGDARRDSFYFAEIHERACAEGPSLLTPAALNARLAGGEMPVFASGDMPGFPNAVPASPSARILAELAARGRGIVARDNLEPIYLRDPYITLPKPPR